MDKEDKPPFQMIRNRDMPRRLAVGKSTFYEIRVDPTFPKPRKLGIAARGYVESEVEAWVNARVED